jgi:hypothetical protein
MPDGTVTFYGADAGDQAGGIITGDFNGDDALDVAIGATLADGPDDNRADAGEVYVFLGPYPEGGSLDAGAGEYDAVFYGAATGDNLGRALAAADFNGDGVDDLVMAAPSATEQSGAVYVMFGGELPAEADLAEAEADVVLRGAATGDFAGIALATGDLDADDVPELVIGALLADGLDNGRAGAGAVYVLPGQDLTAGDTIPLGEVANVVHGAMPGDHLGEALATGDVTGDGTGDLIVVATFSAGPDGSRPGAGSTYVLASPVTFPVDLATATPFLRVVGADEGDQLGHSIAVGDANGDASADIWLGAVSADGGENDVDLAGEGVLVVGGPNPGTVIDARTDLLPVVYGPELEARLGRSVAMGNVMSGAGEETLISAPNADSRAGSVYIFAAAQLPLSTSEATATITGIDAGDILGHESFGIPSLLVAEIGDEMTAVLVSAPGGDGPDNDRTDCGEVYLIPFASLG